MLVSGEGPPKRSLSTSGAGPASSEASGPLAIATSPILLTGVYAWGVAAEPSVRIAAFQVWQQGFWGRPALAVSAGVLALIALVIGVALERARSSSAPLPGVWGFLGLLVVCWLLAPAGIDIVRLDSLRGLLGAGGFALFALSWGVPDVFRRLVPEDNPRADTSTSLEARDRLPSAAVPLAATGIVATAAMAFFAWRIHESPRAQLAQAACGLAGVALISASAEVAVGRRGLPLAPLRTRLRRSLLGLGLLALLAGAGVVQAILLR